MSGFRPKKENSAAPDPGAAGSPQPKTVSETPESLKKAGSALRTLVLLGVFAAVACWALGVRFHLDALNIARPPAGGDTVLELRSGQSVVGKVLSERADSLIFFMEGSEVPFSRNEIKNIRPATEEESRMETTVVGKKPFVTVRKEDTLADKLKNKKPLF